MKHRAEPNDSPCASGTVKERHRLFLGLALLLTVFAEVTPMGHFSSVSTTITSHSDPSAMQQLATFAALAEVAEEEDLDWGSLTRLDRARRRQRPSNAAAGKGEVTASAMRIDPTTTAPSGPAVSTAAPDSDDADSSVEGVGAVSLSAASPPSSASTSRRRPHRRQHHRKGGDAAVTDSRSLSSAHSDSDYGPSSVTSAESFAATPSPAHGGSVHNHKIWSQLHVMEVAYSTRSNNFIDVAARFAEYELMYPIVYQCALNSVICPAEAELLASPATGLDSSRHWACARCGRQHDVVRESCHRCRAPSHFAKLFVGQAVKEVNCAQSLVRLLHATHPDVPLHRIECHSDNTGRGKGCASLYVDRANAPELIAKLDRNVFFDADDSTGELFAHYVYTQQREWLAALAVERAAVERRARGAHLPGHALVVEESRPTHASGQEPWQRQREQHQTSRAQQGCHQRTNPSLIPFAL